MLDTFSQSSLLKEHWMNKSCCWCPSFSTSSKDPIPYHLREAGFSWCTFRKVSYSANTWEMAGNTKKYLSEDHPWLKSYTLCFCFGPLKTQTFKTPKWPTWPDRLVLHHFSSNTNFDCTNNKRLRRCHIFCRRWIRTGSKIKLLNTSRET